MVTSYYVVMQGNVGLILQSDPVYVPINQDDGYSSIDSDDNGILSTH